MNRSSKESPVRAKKPKPRKRAAKAPPAPVDKKKRQEIILSIVSEEEIGSQYGLQERLLEMGISVGQATLSRDIRELHIEKRESESGVVCYCFMKERDDIPYNSIFAQSVISMDYAMNTVVLKCHSGLANGACKVVDDQKFDSIVGTIAGDDTVFILTKSETHAMRLITALKRLLTR